MSDSEFEPFTDKGGRYITTKTASLTMNAHGFLNVPGKVREQILNGATHIEYLTKTKENLLGIVGYDKDNAPPHAYSLSGEGAGSASVDKVLELFGKRPPEEHTMFELEDRDGVACIDVSKLPDIDTNE